jgi:ubiquinone/menaquinone biosynthesis C-methylase UbiE
MSCIEDGSFDSVVCTQVLEHVSDPRKVLDEIFRVLRPGGKALLSVPQCNELHEEPADFYRYTRFGIRALAERCGFEVLVIDQRGQYSSLVAQLRIRYLIDRYRLYQRRSRVLRTLLSVLSYAYSSLAIKIDGWLHQPSAAKHAIGYLSVLKKPEPRRPATCVSTSRG